MLEYHAHMQCFCLMASVLCKISDIQIRVTLFRKLITGGPGSPGSPGGPTTWKKERKMMSK